MRDATRCDACGKPVGLDGREGLCAPCYAQVFGISKAHGKGLRFGHWDDDDLDDGAGEYQRSVPAPPPPPPVAPVRPPQPVEPTMIRVKRPARAAPPPRTTIGRYTVEALLSDGRRSSVYRARDAKLKRPVAIKVLKDAASPVGIDQLEKQVSLLKEVNHPGIAKVYDAGQDGVGAYLTMEYLHGRSLREWIDDIEQGTVRAFAHDELLSIWRQLAEALGALHAHRFRIFHGNLTPSHVMLAPPLRVVLVGFGAALAAAELMGRRRIVGATAYAAPEALDDSIVDERADVFSLGLLMHECVSRVTLGGRGPVPPWYGRRTEWRPPLPNTYDRKLPTDMEQAILKCLETDQLKRCRDTRELGRLLTTAALEKVLPEGRLPRRRITDEHAAPVRPVTDVIYGVLPPASVLAGLQPYTVEGLIARSAHGEVYRARHPEMLSPVAIRLMQAPVDEGLRRRLLARFQHLVQVEHPAVVALIDVGTVHDHLYLVTDEPSGKTLTRVIEERGILPVDEALAIFEQVVDALAGCHARRVLHGDLRPENVLIDGARVRVTGFRLDVWVERTLDSLSTLDDEIIALPSYCTPESLAGDPEDVRSDLYQAGLLLYEMLTAKRATTGATLSQIWEVVLKKMPTSVKFFNPDCPANVITFTQNLLEKKSADRYKDAQTVLRELEAVRAGRPIERTKGRQPPA